MAEAGFFCPSSVAEAEILLPLLVRNGILIDTGSDKFYDSKATCIIQKSENIKSDCEYELEINIPQNITKLDNNLLNATWCTTEDKGSTIINIDKLTLDNIGDQLRILRKYLDDWYISNCDFEIIEPNL